MSTEITMPKLSDTMEEGILISWNISVGEKVERGDIIAEVETDKATMELEAFASGLLLETRVKAGDVVPVGTIIGIIGTEAEQQSTGKVSPSSKNAEQTDEVEKIQEEAKHAMIENTSPITDLKKEIPVEKQVPGSDPQLKKEVSPPVEAKIADTGEKDRGRVEKASPMVRRLARNQGIELSLVTGTGPEGRILKEDLDVFLAQEEEKSSENVSSVNEEMGNISLQQASFEGGSEKLSRMRATIARTVTESWRNIPHFTVTMDIDMGAAEAIHKAYKEAGDLVSLNDIVVKSVATALIDFPRLNGSWADDQIDIHPQINVGVAVTVLDGLLVPVLRNCDALTLVEIAQQSRKLIGKAREGKVSQGDMAGGTFTVSNMGMLGVGEFTAIILPPQSGILAVGTVSDAAVVRNGHIVVARMMKAVLSADHRVVDGAYAAGFMKKLKEILENPIRLLV